MSCPKNYAVSRPQKFSFDRAALRCPDKAKAVNHSLQQLALVPWQIDATSHLGVLTQQIQDVLSTCLPRPKRKPKPEWVSEDVWRDRDLIIDAVKARRRSLSVLIKSYCGFAFKVWKTNRFNRAALDDIVDVFSLDINVPERFFLPPPEHREYCPICLPAVPGNQ